MKSLERLREKKSFRRGLGIQGLRGFDLRGGGTKGTFVPPDRVCEEDVKVKREESNGIIAGSVSVMEQVAETSEADEETKVPESDFESELETSSAAPPSTSVGAEDEREEDHFDDGCSTAYAGTESAYGY